MTITTTSPDHVSDRNAAFERLFNFRDLGGYVAGDGRTIRWGRLYRSDGLQSITDNAVDTLNISISYT